MTDMELLREYAGFSGTPVEMRAVLLSSADHIEKLEAALRGVIDNFFDSTRICEIARKALEGKDGSQEDL
jgi:hypothetical protein